MHHTQGDDMATIERKGWLFMVYSHDFANEDYMQQWRPDWRPYKPDDNEERVCIGEHTLVVDVPENFDPIPKQVAALEAKKREALEKYQQEVSSINERLSKLQAITFEPAEAGQ
jgi:hypothetical protein